MKAGSCQYISIIYCQRSFKSTIVIHRLSRTEHQNTRGNITSCWFAESLTNQYKCICSLPFATTICKTALIVSMQTDGSTQHVSSNNNGLRVLTHAFVSETGYNLRRPDRMQGALTRRFYVITIHMLMSVRGYTPAPVLQSDALTQHAHHPSKLRYRAYVLVIWWCSAIFDTTHIIYGYDTNICSTTSKNPTVPHKQHTQLNWTVVISTINCAAHAHEHSIQTGQKKNVTQHIRTITHERGDRK